MFYQFTFYFMCLHVNYWKSLLKIIAFIKNIYKNEWLVENIVSFISNQLNIYFNILSRGTIYQ